MEQKIKIDNATITDPIVAASLTNAMYLARLLNHQEGTKKTEEEMLKNIIGAYDLFLRNLQSSHKRT